MQNIVFFITDCGEEVKCAVVPHNETLGVGQEIRVKVGENVQSGTCITDSFFIQSGGEVAGLKTEFGVFFGKDYTLYEVIGKYTYETF